MLVWCHVWVAQTQFLPGYFAACLSLNSVSVSSCLGGVGPIEGRGVEQPAGGRASWDPGGQVVLQSLHSLPVRQSTGVVPDCLLQPMSPLQDWSINVLCLYVCHNGPERSRWEDNNSEAGYCYYLTSILQHDLG